MTRLRRAARALVLPAALLPAPAAWATSCVTDPLATPTALADGTYTGWEEDFFDRYDYALVGTATDTSTGLRGGLTTASSAGTRSSQDRPTSSRSRTGTRTA